VYTSKFVAVKKKIRGIVETKSSLESNQLPQSIVMDINRMENLRYR
jgi:hypothetical protein